MKIVLISDTHDGHPDIPNGDVLIHAGDFACGDDLYSLRKDINWLKSLPHPTKILVRGNHDLILNCQANARDLLSPILLLDNESVEIASVQFYGVAWKSTPAIPAGTDVVISHEPCEGILDAGTGSSALRRAVFIARPKLFVSGHAHGARGHVVLDGIHFYNATLDTSDARAVAAMSHRIELPKAEPWIHELDIKTAWK
jgi:calcineurin-like phosphoesterase family protein